VVLTLFPGRSEAQPTGSRLQRRGRVRIVEQLSVRDGSIMSSTFVTDMAGFMALMGQ
jgi:hypothetical protein